MSRCLREVSSARSSELASSLSMRIIAGSATIAMMNRGAVSGPTVLLTSPDTTMLTARPPANSGFCHRSSTIEAKSTMTASRTDVAPFMPPLTDAIPVMNTTSRASSDCAPRRTRFGPSWSRTVGIARPTVATKSMRPKVDQTATPPTDTSTSVMKRAVR